jgi:hypothetical protein
MDEEPPIAALDDCCQAEAKRSLHKHRDVAICSCGRLLLAWDNPEEQRKTRAELRGHGVAFAEGRLGTLFVTAKARPS